MEIYINDETNRLNDTAILDLMTKAADTSLQQEFGDSLSDLEFDVLTIPVDLSVSIVDKDEIKALNAEYRGIDKVTDVLSLPQFADRDELMHELASISSCLEACEDTDYQTDPDEMPAVLLGDVVICYDKAEEQAAEYGTGIRRELVYLFVHSIFHLFGYDHMQDDEKLIMRQREEAVMEVVGL